MKRKIVTKVNMIPGMKVIPGRDWTYGDQDNDSEYGILGNVSPTGKDWYTVEWSNGNRSNRYRVGSSEKAPCDLYFYESPAVDPKFENDVQKFFKMNDVSNITPELMIENNLEKWMPKTK